MKTESEYRKQYAELAAQYRAKPNLSLREELRHLAVRIRAARKPAFLAASTRQAYAAKVRMIMAGKGKNGKSMSKELMDLHWANR